MLHVYSTPPNEWELVTEEPTNAKRSASSSNVGEDEEVGYWDEPALVALLKAFAAQIPTFKYRRLRHGFAVTCPGQLELGWPDGSAHSDADKTRLDHETLVWIRNGWPVFRCVHAHCDGGVADLEKKTWKDFVEFFDPLRIRFNFDQWQEAETARADQHFLAEYGGAPCQS